MDGLGCASVTVPLAEFFIAGEGVSGLSDERPGAARAPGRITGRGHRRPRLYRARIVALSSLGFKYPGGMGAEPPLQAGSRRRRRKFRPGALQRGWVDALTPASTRRDWVPGRSGRLTLRRSRVGLAFRCAR